MSLETERMILSFYSLSHGEIPFLEGGNESSGIAPGRKDLQIDHSTAISSFNSSYSSFLFLWSTRAIPEASYVFELRNE